MSIQLPLLLAPAGSLLPDSLGSIAGSAPLGDIHALLILLAVAPSMLMLVILVVYQLRGSRIDNEPASAAKPQTESKPELQAQFMRGAIEQLNGIAVALHNVIPNARQAPDQTAPGSAAKVVNAGQLDRFDESASRTAPLPLTGETPPGVDHDKALAQLAAKVCKLTELTSRMQDEEQALKRDAVDPQLASEEAAPSKHYLTFSLRDEQFAVSIQNIHGVVEAARLIAEPSMPPKIRQAIRLQGALVPVIDLGARFGGQAIEFGRNSRIVVLKAPSGDRLQLFGALVDSVGDLLELPAVEIEPPTASGSRIRDEFTQGTLMLDNRPVTLLDISQGFSSRELVPHSAARPTKPENQPS